MPMSTAVMSSIRIPPRSTTTITIMSIPPPLSLVLGGEGGEEEGVGEGRRKEEGGERGREVEGEEGVEGTGERRMRKTD